LEGVGRETKKGGERGIGVLHGIGQSPSVSGSHSWEPLRKTGKKLHRGDDTPQKGNRNRKKIGRPRAGC